MCVWILFYVTAEHHSTVRPYHILFMHSSISRHLGCFHLLINAAMHIGVAASILYVPFYLNLTTVLHCRCGLLSPSDRFENSGLPKPSQVTRLVVRWALGPRIAWLQSLCFISLCFIVVVKLVVGVNVGLNGLPRLFLHPLRLAAGTKFREEHYLVLFWWLHLGGNFDSARVPFALTPLQAPARACSSPPQCVPSF